MAKSPALSVPTPSSAPEDFTGIFEGNGANVQRYDTNRMTLTPDTPAQVVIFRRPE